MAKPRLTVYVEPRDLWIGAYVSPRAIYVCLLPCLVIRWERRWINIGADFRRLRPELRPDAKRVSRG